MIYLVLAAWYISGVLSLIYWWTKDFDFTSEEILITLLGGFAGPFMFILGWSVHSRYEPRKILIRKQK